MRLLLALAFWQQFKLYTIVVLIVIILAACALGNDAVIGR